MLDISAIPVKLGEPKRLATLGFGIGAMIMSTMVSADTKWNKRLKFGLLGVAVTVISATVAGYLNPVTVGKGLAPGDEGMYKAIPAGYGQWTRTRKREPQYQYGAGSGIVDVGKGKVMPVYGDAYGASTIIPAGPATMAQAEVDAYQAEPTYLRYVTGVENEGKIIGQGG